jgi:hypothetical protein
MKMANMRCNMQMASSAHHAGHQATSPSTIGSPLPAQLVSKTKEGAAGRRVGVDFSVDRKDTATERQSAARRRRRWCGR